MTEDLRDELMLELGKLPDERLRVLLAQLRAEAPPRRRPRSPLGPISAEDAALMLRVIEEEFEQVDPDEW